uniref:Uncharacterized protein n=1 Tax=Rhizophora mucronata TaxID=61149 RepID=A0A2P2Q7F3_RHIMU
MLLGYYFGAFPKQLVSDQNYICSSLNYLHEHIFAKMKCLSNSLMEFLRYCINSISGPILSICHPASL